MPRPPTYIYSKEELDNALQRSYSLAEAFNLLGVPKQTNVRRRIRRELARLGLDKKHFKFGRYPRASAFYREKEIMICRGCGQGKSFSEFYKNTDRNSRRTWCKKCHNLRNVKNDA